MNKITKQEARELTATKVMGWNKTYESSKGTILYGDNGPEDSTYCRTWNPLAPDKLHQCFGMLDKWCEENGLATLVINDAGMQDRCCRCFLYIYYDCIEVAQACHEDLSHAIVSAILQAVTGETYEIED